MTRTFSYLLCGGLAAASLASAAPAPDPAVYTLPECVRLGLRQAASVRNARRDEDIAGARLRQVVGQVLPQLSVNADYTRFDETPSMTFDGERVDMGRADNYSASAGLSQLLYRGGWVRAALKGAFSYRDLTRFSTEQSENELVRDIRAGFANVLLTEAAVRVQADSVAQLSNLVAQAESKYRQQTASEFDLLTARVRLANELPNLIRSRKNVQLARAAFRNLVQLEAADYVLSGDLEHHPVDGRLEEWQQKALAGRPELAQQKKRIELGEADLRAEKGGALPEVRAHAAYEGLNPESGSAEDAWDWGWNAGISLTWSLYDGGQRRATILQKALEAAKARETLADLERAVALEVEQQYLEMAQAEETIAAGRETVALAEKGLDIARTRYENGLATYLEFTDANLALSTARLTWLAALHEHMNARARLECAAGLGAESLQGEQP